MVIVMRIDATQNDIDYVIARAHSLGLEARTLQDNGRTLVGLLGDLHALDPTALAGLRGVERVGPMRQPFLLTSRDFKPESTVVSIEDCHVGGDQVVLIAGPCAVESRTQLLETAWAVKEVGAQMLRGGAFKPRTSPYSFQGLGESALELLAEARQETGLRVVTEVLS
jgi:3-deoxy-7-phosphoheptulonate synthase